MNSPSDKPLDNGECLAYKCYKRTVIPNVYCLDHTLDEILGGFNDYITSYYGDDGTDYDQTADKIKALLTTERQQLIAENISNLDDIRQRIDNAQRRGSWNSVLNTMKRIDYLKASLVKMRDKS